MSDNEYEIIHRETLFQGYYRVDRLHIRQKMEDGSWGAIYSREVFDGNKEAAVVLLFDPKQDKVVLIEELRSGPLSKGDENPYLMEAVAGTVDPGEQPETTAKREALEEAGCTVTELQKIFSYYPAPGCFAERVTLYIGRTQAPAQGGICGLAQEGEYIRVYVMDALKAINLLYTGTFRDAATLIAMQWFALNHTALRSRWLISDTSGAII
ncbi:MAG: NUDIX domain-containing protein [Alphaproteobacteria bacterium]|nr:NUDIX domain-containing protein [Alphaproteobacteria bacterium]